MEEEGEELAGERWAIQTQDSPARVPFWFQPW